MAYQDIKRALSQRGSGMESNFDKYKEISSYYINTKQYPIFIEEFVSNTHVTIRYFKIIYGGLPGH